MGRQRPKSVTYAVRVQWALVVVSGLSTLLTVVMRDDLLLAWAQADAEAAPIVAEGGLEALEQSTLSVPAFVPVAVVSFIVYATLAWVLGVLFREGHRWTRYALLALAVGSGFAVVVILRAGPPAPFWLLGAVTVVLDAVVVWFVVQRDTGEWIRGVELAERRPATGRTGSPADPH